MQGAFSALPNFTRNSDSLTMRIILSDKSFKVAMWNASLELPDLNEMQFNNLYMQMAMQNAILELSLLFWLS